MIASFSRYPSSRYPSSRYSSFRYSSELEFLKTRCRIAGSLGLVLFILLSAPQTYANSKTQGKVIAGWVEKISLPESGASSKAVTVKAKLDTGAETSSIHAEDIQTFTRDGKTWVDFTLVLKDSQGKVHRVAQKKPRKKRVKIKKHDGVHDRRSIVELDICFDGRIHSALFSLADRSEFIYPVLLGRKFLKGIAIVDSQESFLTQAHCD